jgi:MFS family permease
MKARSLQVLRVAAFRRLLAATSAYAGAASLEVIALGWFVFDTTDSVLLTALTWSARALPNVLFGGVAGVIADRYPRHRVLVVNGLVRAAALVGMGATALWLEGSVLALLCLSAISGVSQTQQRAALTSLATETVPADQLSDAVTTTALAQRIATLLGAVGGGYLVSAFGPAPVFAIAAASAVGAATAIATVPSQAHSASGTRRFRDDLFDGIKALREIPVVVQLVGLAALTEIFGFACASLMPAIVADQFGRGATSLGWMGGAASVGGLIGVLALSAFPGPLIRAAGLSTCFVVFGLSVLGLALADTLAAGLVLYACFGAAAGMIDTTQWSLLQMNVDAKLRGRVMGAWNVAVGFGWIGPLLLGALADSFGLEIALGVAGATLLCVGALSFASRTLRSARSSAL